MPIPVGVTLNSQQISYPIKKFFYYAIPLISNLIPSRGPTTGETIIKVKGINMFPLKNILSLNISKTTLIKFGLTPAKAILKSRSQIIAISPIHSPGNVSVKVFFFILIFSFI